MEITIKKDELAQKLFDQFTNNLLANAAQQNLDQEETDAHLVINRKRLIQDANNIANLVFSVYGVAPEESVVEGSAE